MQAESGIFAICTEGKMTATINLIDYEIKPNDLITLLPGTIIQFRERTEKVRLCFAGFSSECVERINLIKSMVSSFSKITECPIVELQEDIASYLIDYFSLLARVTCDEKLSLLRNDRGVFKIDPDCRRTNLSEILLEKPQYEP